MSEPAAWIIHDIEDEYYGRGPDTVRFCPLLPEEEEAGVTATPLVSCPQPHPSQWRGVMYAFERFCFGAIFGLCVGMLVAAYAQNGLDDRAVASGFMIHKSRAYQLVPQPTTTNPNSRSGE